MSGNPTSALESWRLFVAICVPEEVKSAISMIQSQLRAVVPDADISWTKREQFHLTLKFLGAIPAARSEPLFRDIREACRPFRPFVLSAKGVGFFPERREPRVVWMGIEEDGALKALQEAVATAASGYSEADRRERFAGHVTLGRIRRINRADADALKARGRELSGTSAGRWTVMSVDVMRSFLSSTGGGTNRFVASLWTIDPFPKRCRPRGWTRRLLTAQPGVSPLGVGDDLEYPGKTWWESSCFPGTLIVIKSNDF